MGRDRHRSRVGSLRYRDLGRHRLHWILVHGLEGDHFIAHDPWSEVSQGESWLDAYDVPLSADALNRIAWTGDPPYRAMLSFIR